jgi:hypothetical protein
MHPTTCSSSRVARVLGLLGLAAPMLIAMVDMAYAQASQLLPEKKTCTTLNCEATVVDGALTGTGTNSVNPRSIPWVAQVAGSPNTCLRFDVVSSVNNAQNPNFLEMTVVSPNNGVRTVGFIQNPNQPNNNCCPKVIVGSIPVAGFYTVIINDNGGGPARGKFKLKYAMYNAGNPNCAKPTPQQ